MRIVACLTLSIFAACLSSTTKAEGAQERANSPTRCQAATANQAIDAAEKALLDTSTDAQARALACVIAALKAIDTRRLDIMNEDSKIRLLEVPRNP